MKNKMPTNLPEMTDVSLASSIISLEPEIEDYGLWSMVFRGPASQFLGDADGSLITRFLSVQEDILKRFKISFQMFRPTKFIAKEVLTLAAYHAKRGFDSKSNISKTLPMEWLLYMSGQRQISIALEDWGVKVPDSSDQQISVGIVLFGNKNNLLQAITHFNSKVAKTYLTPLTWLSSGEYGKFLETEKISLIQIHNNLQAYGEVISEKAKTIGVFLEDVGEMSVKRAIIDVINSRMVALSLTNIRLNSKEGL